VWSASDATVLARETGIADDAPGEGSQHGLGPTFPHSIAAATEKVRAFQLTPFADEVLTDTAIAALGGEELGEDNAPDYLAISYSSHDFAAHNWGQGSWEELDLLLRLDLQIDRLLDALDAKLGHDGYAVILTSDHGATPLVERSPHRGARRIPVQEIQDTAEAAMDKVLGPGPWVATIAAMEVYVTPAFALVPDATRRDDALGAAVDAIRMLPGIRDAGRLAPIAAACPAGEDAARVCASYAAGASGDIYLIPVDGSLITEYTTGSHHDAPSDDDRTVPLIVRAPGVPARESYAAVSPLQVAPTIAHLLGIPAPEAAQAPALELVPAPPGPAGAAAASAAAKNGE
jgi:arylsulfatase A-like enzyme